MDKLNKGNLVISLVGCIGWCAAMLLINLGYTDPLIFSLTALSFVFAQRAEYRAKLKLDLVKTLLLGFLAIGVFYSLIELVGVNVLLLTIFSSKVVAISSTLLILLMPYRAMKNRNGIVSTR